MESFHNGLLKLGPFRGYVCLVLPNGYGIVLTENGIEYPSVAPILVNEHSDRGCYFDFRWEIHPDFVKVRLSESGCTPVRALQILEYLRKTTNR